MLETLTGIIPILTIIISVLLAFFTIRRFYFDISKKREVHDFEIINKYFSKECIKQLREESKIIQDMACRTLFSFKGLNFEEIDNLLSKKNIGFYEISNITRLRKYKYINSDLSKNHKYNPKIRTFWAIGLAVFSFFIYIIMLLSLYVYLAIIYSDRDIILNLSLIFTVGGPEIIMLTYIDKRLSLERSISWFNKKSKDFLPQIIT